MTLNKKVEGPTDGMSGRQTVMGADVLPAGTQSVYGMNTHLKKGCTGVRCLAVQHHECVHTCRLLAFQVLLVLCNRGERLLARLHRPACPGGAVEPLVPR